jgi:glyoxylase-like metal-dependent hydrolase (beta-lactamase superfamily II)
MTEPPLTSSQKVPLPKANAAQPTIQLSRLPAGEIHLPLWMFVAGSSKDSVSPCPSMSWLLLHPPTNKRIIFDLGLPKDVSCLTQAVQDRLRKTFTIKVEEDVFDGLESLGLDPKSDIDTVIFSHLHYDHIGNPAGFGPDTSFIVGPSALSLISGPDSYPSNPRSHFDSALLPLDRTTELPPGTDRTFWRPAGPFPETHDHFGDGSLFIVNSPGHLAGHINLLVRVEAEKWIYLAGDSCHDVRILRGEAETAVYPDPEVHGRTKCAHADKGMAEEHLKRVRSLMEEYGVEVVLAHDFQWVEDNKGRFK